MCQGENQHLKMTLSTIRKSNGCPGEGAGKKGRRKENDCPRQLAASQWAWRDLTGPGQFLPHTPATVALDIYMDLTTPARHCQGEWQAPLAKARTDLRGQQAGRNSSCSVMLEPCHLITSPPHAPSDFLNSLPGENVFLLVGLVLLVCVCVRNSTVFPSHIPISLVPDPDLITMGGGDRRLFYLRCDCLFHTSLL